VVALQDKDLLVGVLVITSINCTSILFDSIHFDDFLFFFRPNSAV
jgi:hypothetical protein